METQEMLLTVEEAARRTSTSRSKFYDLVRAGEVRAIRVAGQLRIPVAELESWMAKKVAESKSAALTPDTLTNGNDNHE